MTPTTRTRLGIALFLPLAALLLATFACLPAPVGDPEKSKIDDTLSGAWRGIPTEPGDKEQVLVILKPWDAKTYFLKYVTTDTKDGKDLHQMLHFKAWLTTLGNATFITCQPLDDAPAEKPYWAVLRVDKKPAGLDIRMVNPESELIKDKNTREQLEAIIAAHLDDKTLFGNAITFKKLAKDDAFIADTLKKFNTTGDLAPKP